MSHVLLKLLRDDRRYKLDAYLFVRDALAFAHDEMRAETALDEQSAADSAISRHVTGQELCEAMRRYALDQYGLLAKVVLNSWGVNCTSDFGEVVYNLIQIEMLRKSDSDRREDFDDVFDFDKAFEQGFEITMSE